MHGQCDMSVAKHQLRLHLLHVAPMLQTRLNMNSASKQAAGVAIVTADWLASAERHASRRLHSRFMRLTGRLMSAVGTSSLANTTIGSVTA